MFSLSDDSEIRDALKRRHNLAHNLANSINEKGSNNIYAWNSVPFHSNHTHIHTHTHIYNIYIYIPVALCVRHAVAFTLYPHEEPEDTSEDMNIDEPLEAVDHFLY